MGQINTAAISRNIDIESVLQPIEKASGLPNYAYVSDEYMAYERDHVLGKGWAGLGFTSDLPKKGYVKPIRFMGIPLLIVRNKKDQIRVFHNVCSHRGMMLVDQEAEIRRALRCPYHSWSYSLDGELINTPHIGGMGKQQVDGFNHCDHGLKAVRSAIWMGVIFINLSGDALEFGQYIKPLSDRWRVFFGDSGYARMTVPNEGEGEDLQLEVQSNWKLAVENYCESYHLPWIHPDLNRYSKLDDHYHIMIGDNFSGQGSNAYRLSAETGTTLTPFPEWPKDRLEQAEYIAFYPNVLLGIQADHAFAMIIEPVAANRSVERLRLFYVENAATDDSYASSRDATLKSWRVIFGEDVDAVEGMQKGRASPGYQGGVFSPVMDNPTHHFHQWVARKFKAAAQIY